jgi:Mg-chelatase subunit ChlD
MSPRIVLATLTLSFLVTFGASNPATAYRLIEGGVIACGSGYLHCEDDAKFNRWFEFNVNYHVNVDAAADANAQLSQQDMIDVTQLSFQAWDDVPGTMINLVYAGETLGRVSALDGINTVLWYNDAKDVDGCLTAFGFGHGGVLATTLITQDYGTGEIEDVDIVFNTYEEYVWEWNPPPADPTCSGNVYDIQGTLTHEVGHLLGIHHSDFDPEDATLRPTMVGGWCDAAGARRTLEPDDEDAVRCLYPITPTLLLIDESGSMEPLGKMAGAQNAANNLIDAFPKNLMAVASFADADEGCPFRSGYELLADWTGDAGSLHAAVNGTSACGMTPLWEALCCAIHKAAEQQPSNVVVYTDGNELSSNGLCGCLSCCQDENDVLALAQASEVTIYVINFWTYSGSGAAPTSISSAVWNEPGAGHLRMGNEGANLLALAQATGGLYFEPDGQPQLFLAEESIRRHIGEFSKSRQNPPDPLGFPLADIQRYTPQCDPDSPYDGLLVTVEGQVTVPPGTFDPAVQYIEDRSGGIRVVGTVSAPFPSLGDHVALHGTVTQSEGEIEISGLRSYSIVASDVLPDVPTVDPVVARLCGVIGSRLSVRGWVAGPVVGSQFPLSVSWENPTGVQPLTVFIDPDTGIDPATIRPGDLLVVTGVISRELGINRLMPRSSADLEFEGTVVGVDSPLHEVASRPRIGPNPSRGEVRVAYALARPGQVMIRIYDAQGRLVRDLLNRALPAGEGYTIRWDGRNDRGRQSAAGVYFLRFRSPDVVESKPVLLLR